MKPSELSLFSEKEQTLLVATEKARLSVMSEDDLGDLLALVRKARTKYTGLHRRQAAASIGAAGKRAAASASNQRTLRKAEIFEDALARVSAALAAAARVTRDELKQERLAAARAAGTGAARPGRSAASGKPAGTPRSTRTGSGAGGKGHVSGRRAASTRAAGARTQARRDRPR